jgi:CBS domain-containing protein
MDATNGVLRETHWLDGHQVRDVMTRKVVTVHADATVEQATALMRDHRVGALPVKKAGVLIGMLTDRDVTVRVLAEGLDPRLTRVRAVMTPRIAFIPAEWPLEDAARMMADLHVHRLAVLDGDLKLIGILSEHDL